MKYSVIIPIYNAEKSLRRCLDSLLPQLNNDIEVLLINDGSTDTSGEICKEYVEKSSSFQYFEQENSGVSAARNLGIEKASGDYITFIDSDDYVTQQMLVIMDRAISEYCYDYVVFPEAVTDGMSERNGYLLPFESTQKTMFYPRLADMICKKQINGPVSKIFKKRIIDNNNIRFPVGCSVAEDRAFNINYILNIESLCITNEAFYYVVVTEKDSLSRTVRAQEKERIDYEIETNYLFKMYVASDLDEKYLKQIIAADNFCTCRQVYSRAKRMKLRGANRKEIMKGIRKDCKEINAKRLDYPKTNFCRKIYLPVKFRQYWLIYAVSMKLAKSAS